MSPLNANRVMKRQRQSLIMRLQRESPNRANRDTRNRHMSRRPWKRSLRLIKVRF